MTSLKKYPQFYYKNNRFQQLRGFYFSAKLGNITKAAEVMHLTQPSISLQIKALEDDLACQLLKRKGPKIHLTKEGHILLELIQPLVENIDNLKDNFHVLTKKTHNTCLKTNTRNKTTTTTRLIRIHIRIPKT